MATCGQRKRIRNAHLEEAKKGSGVRQAYDYITVQDIVTCQYVGMIHCFGVRTKRMPVVRAIVNYTQIDANMTWQDIAQIVTIYEHLVEDGVVQRFGDSNSIQEASEKILEVYQILYQFYGKSQHKG